MFHMPISSPMMKTMFGCFPDGGVAAGCCATAFCTLAAVPSADAAASVVLASNTLRRLSVPFFRFDLSPSLALDISFLPALMAQQGRPSQQALSENEAECCYERFFTQRLKR